MPRILAIILVACAAAAPYVLPSSVVAGSDADAMCAGESWRYECSYPNQGNHNGAIFQCMKGKPCYESVPTSYLGSQLAAARFAGVVSGTCTGPSTCSAHSATDEKGGTSEVTDSGADDVKQGAQDAAAGLNQDETVGPADTPNLSGGTPPAGSGIMDEPPTPSETSTFQPPGGQSNQPSNGGFTPGGPAKPVEVVNSRVDNAPRPGTAAYDTRQAALQEMSSEPPPPLPQSWADKPYTLSPTRVISALESFAAPLMWSMMGSEAPAVSSLSSFSGGSSGFGGGNTGGGFWSTPTAQSTGFGSGAPSIFSSLNGSGLQQVSSEGGSVVYGQGAGPGGPSTFDNIMAQTRAELAAQNAGTVDDYLNGDGGFACGSFASCVGEGIQNAGANLVEGAQGLYAGARDALFGTGDAEPGSAFDQFAQSAGGETMTDVTPPGAGMMSPEQIQEAARAYNEGVAEASAEMDQARRDFLRSHPGCGANPACVAEGQQVMNEALARGFEKRGLDDVPLPVRQEALNQSVQDSVLDDLGNQPGDEHSPSDYLQQRFQRLEGAEPPPPQTETFPEREIGPTSLFDSAIEWQIADAGEIASPMDGVSLTDAAPLFGSSDGFDRLTGFGPQLTDFEAPQAATLGNPGDGILGSGSITGEGPSFPEGALAAGNPSITGQASCYGSPACGDSKSWADSVTDNRGRHFNPDTENVAAVPPGSPFKYGDYVKVERLDKNGNVIGEVVAQVRDTCPASSCGNGRVIDLSTAAAKELGYAGGVAQVRVSATTPQQSFSDALLAQELSDYSYSSDFKDFASGITDGRGGTLVGLDTSIPFESGASQAVPDVAASTYNEPDLFSQYSLAPPGSVGDSIAMKQAYMQALPSDPKNPIFRQFVPDPVTGGVRDWETGEIYPATHPVAQQLRNELYNYVMGDDAPASVPVAVSAPIIELAPTADSPWTNFSTTPPSSLATLTDLPNTYNPWYVPSERTGTSYYGSTDAERAEILAYMQNGEGSGSRIAFDGVPVDVLQVSPVSDFPSGFPTAPVPGSAPFAQRTVSTVSIGPDGDFIPVIEAGEVPAAEAVAVEIEASPVSEVSAQASAESVTEIRAGSYSPASPVSLASTDVVGYLVDTSPADSAVEVFPSAHPTSLATLVDLPGPSVEAVRFSGDAISAEAVPPTSVLAYEYRDSAPIELEALADSDVGSMRIVPVAAPITIIPSAPVTADPSTAPTAAPVTSPATPPAVPAAPAVPRVPAPPTASPAAPASPPVYTGGPGTGAPSGSGSSGLGAGGQSQGGSPAGGSGGGNIFSSIAGLFSALTGGSGGSDNSTHGTGRYTSQPSLLAATSSILHTQAPTTRFAPAAPLTAAPQVSLVANPNPVNPGQGSSVSWTAEWAAAQPAGETRECAAIDGSGRVLAERADTSGTFELPALERNTYVVVGCKQSGGKHGSASVVIMVRGDTSAAPLIPSSVASYESTTGFSSAASDLTSAVYGTRTASEPAQAANVACDPNDPVFIDCLTGEMLFVDRLF